MWLLFLLFINPILSCPSLTDLEKSSNHLCITFDLIQFNTITRNSKCFAKTKTLKSLRKSNYDEEIITDLGFNWEDNCDYLP